MTNVRAMQAALRTIADSLKSGTAARYDGHVLDRIANDLEQLTARDLFSYRFPNLVIPTTNETPVVDDSPLPTLSTKPIGHAAHPTGAVSDT